MSLSEGEIEFALELFSGLGGVTPRRMFGGMCLYHEGTAFCLVRRDGSIMLKGKGAFRDRIEAEGWEAWDYVRKNGKKSVMPYWRMPEAALDDPELACELAREALEHL